MSPVAPALDHDVARWLPAWAETRPDALAWADDHRRCDYASASDRVARLAGWLRHEAGIESGDRIALWLGNRSATLEGLFAAAHLGAIALPVNARLTATEVAFQLDDCEPKVVLIEADWRDRAADTTARMQGASPSRWLAVGGPADEYEAAIAASAPAPLRAAADPDDAMILMYTSGTTGKPKGALLPVRKTLYNGINATGVFDTRPDDRLLIAAPLFHSLALQILSLPALFRGAGLVIQDRFDAAEAWRAIEREGITYYGGVPTMHARMLTALDEGDPFTQVPASLRFVFSAGAAAPAELVRAFHARGLPMVQGYGQTETSMLTCLSPQNSLEKAGSVGRPLQHAELRLVATADLDGPVAGWRDVGAGEVGEIVVRGPITMLEYWRRPEATAETLRDGWVRTGDLATRDDDFDVTLVGRAREMYISGGENVYPAEVEATLVEHEAVAEAAVVAIPDPEWGEIGRAHLVAEPGRVIDPEAVLAWLEPRLARYKHPRRVVIETELPRTASGKIQKHRLVESGPEA